MTKPVCVPCQRFFRPKKNGFSWVEGMPEGNNVLPGDQEPERWKPYKLWNSDLWECQGCGAQIVVGHAGKPISIQHEADFAQRVASEGATLQVNDC